MARAARHQRPHRSLVLFVPLLALCFCWAPAFVGSHTKIARRILVSSQAAADPAVLAAAKQVKTLQNSGPSGLKQWSEYVKTFADAKDGSFNFSPDEYDDAGFLVDFVSNYNDGYRLSSVGAAVAEGADLEESGVFKGALDDHLRAQDVTDITAMSENVAGEFLKLCGQLFLKGSGAIPAKKKAVAASVSSSASEVAQQVSGVQNSGPSGAKQWALYLQSFDEGNSPSGSPADFDDDFLRDFLDNFNDGYRLKSVSAAAAECAQLESSGTFAKAMEHFLRSKKQNTEIHSVADKTASEFFKTCGKLVSQSHAEEVIEPETPQAKTPPPPPLPPIPPSAQTLQIPPLPPLPTTEPKNSKKSMPLPAKEKVVAPLKSSGTQQVKAADASRPPPKKAPAPSKGSAWAPKPTLEPQALDAKMKLNDWIHSRLKRKPTLEDVMFGFRFEEVGGKQRYGAELVFMNKELAPGGTVVYEGTPQVTKKDAMDSAAYKALVELNVQP